MRYVSSKIIKTKPLAYRLVLEVTDREVEFLEDICNCVVDLEGPPFEKFLRTLWHTFWQLWRKHDKDE